MCYDAISTCETMQTQSDFLIFPTNGYEFDTHTDIQNGFIQKIDEAGIYAATQWLLQFKESNDFSFPRSIKFLWKSDGSETYNFEISKAEDFSDSYTVQTHIPSCELDNLEIGTKYFWRVNNSNANYFYTKDNGIRFIRVDGALNVRDLGGNKIKQGLVYRGSDIYTDYIISEAGKATLKDRLNIKSEVELRIESDPTRPSVIGDGVNFVYLPYRPYIEIFEEQHRRGICRIMEFFSREENYPVYVHCLGGADRTGMIALFLRALSGESNHFIHTDYELTSLSSYAYGLTEGAGKMGIRRRTDSYYAEFLSVLDEYAPGKPLHQKVTNFLLSCGVSQETIDKVVSILTDTK